MAMTSSDLGLLVLRLVVGLTMSAHGAQKAFGWWKGSGWAGWEAVMVRMGFRPPALWAAVAVAAELVGGLLLAVGFLTPLAAMALLGQSVVIIIKAHWSRGFWGRDGGYEFPLSLAAGVVAIVGIGAGALSLDTFLGFSWSVEVRLALAALGIVGGLAAIAVTRIFPAPKPHEPAS
jgi:putative oxidoreductase